MFVGDAFGRQICTGFHQARDLIDYFQSSPDFCPNCSFTDAADKFYWFDQTLPFLPLWITLIGEEAGASSLLL